MKFEEIKQVLDDTDEETLVVFDVDRTLLKMGDQILVEGKSGFLKKIRNYPLYTALSEQEKDILLSIVLRKTAHEVIEQEVVGMIRSLQKRHIKVIACSSMVTGSFGYIHDMATWRVESLRDEGLDFSNAFPESREVIFSVGVSKPFPSFKDGVLLTAKKSKAEALMLFLEAISWRPHRIIMIDDQIKHLEPTEKEVNNFSIEFQGVQYRYIEKYLEGRITDDELAEFQINYLLNHWEWLTDEESLKALIELENR